MAVFSSATNASLNRYTPTPDTPQSPSLPKPSGQAFEHVPADDTSVLAVQYFVPAGNESILS